MKIVVIAGLAESLINFRGVLLDAWVEEGHKVIACAPGEHADIAVKLQAMGIVYQPLRLKRTSINPIRDLRALAELTIFLIRSRPDIVFSYTIKPVIYGSISAGLVGIPHIFSMITGLGYTFMGATLKQRLINLGVQRLYRFALARNQAVFFQNPDDLSLFVNSRLVRNSSEPVLINGSGVDLTYFSRTSHVVKPLAFLLIARLIRDKGIIEYVEAARILKKRYPGTFFRLLGPFDSNPSAIPESQVKIWQCEGAVEYLGVSDDVRPFLADASVYVLPSYREGTPRTVLEAMAMGRPIVTTDAPGCRETVKEGENGFLVPVKDVGALVDAMEKFIRQPELIEKMGLRSREIAEEKYDVHKVNAVIMRTMGLLHEKDV